MPNSLAPIVRSLSTRTSLSLTRTSLFNFMILLAGVFAAAAYSLIYLAHDMDQSEQAESAFHTRKAMQSMEKSMRLTVKDYAFWSDAYKHLHLKVDNEWAYTRGNIGATLFDDFGFQGLFVVNDANRTVYAVVDGRQRLRLLRQVVCNGGAAPTTAATKPTAARWAGLHGTGFVDDDAAATQRLANACTSDRRLSRSWPASVTV